MNLTLQLFLIAVIIIFFMFIVHLLRKGTLSLKYSLLWLGAAVVLFVMVIIPQLPQMIAELVGVEVSSNLVFMAEGIFVLLMLISLTAIVSKQNARLLRLSQNVAVLEKRIRELEEKVKNQ